jgi:hypothetical protein
MNSFIKQIPNLLTEDYCKNFLNNFESLNLTPEVNLYNFDGVHQEYKHFAKYDELEDFDKEICSLVNIEVEKYLEEYKRFYTLKNKLEGSSLIKLTKLTELPLHYDPECSAGDRRNLTVLLYLHKCQNGELYFPMQKELIIPEPGKLLIFPAFFTHPHRVLPCVDRDRYTYRFNYIIEE